MKNNLVGLSVLFVFLAALVVVSAGCVSSMEHHRVLDQGPDETSTDNSDISSRNILLGTYQAYREADDIHATNTAGFVHVDRSTSCSRGFHIPIIGGLISSLKGWVQIDVCEGYPAPVGPWYSTSTDSYYNAPYDYSGVRSVYRAVGPLSNGRGRYGY